MGTKTINAEDLDGKKNEEGKCAEAGKTVLGNTSFQARPGLHSLPRPGLYSLPG